MDLIVSNPRQFTGRPQPWQEGEPNQSQTLEDTLLGYTSHAAYAEHMEHEKGILKAGYLADVVMLSEDIFQTPKEEMLHVKAVLTICDWTSHARYS